MSALISRPNQIEVRKLIKNPHIIYMAVDLKLMGLTADKVWGDAKFGALNDKYQEITGKTCRRIGSVLEAVVLVMRDLD